MTFFSHRPQIVVFFLLLSNFPVTNFISSLKTSDDLFLVINAK